VSSAGARLWYAAFMSSPFSLVLSGILGMGVLSCEGTAARNEDAPVAPNDGAADPPLDAPVSETNQEPVVVAGGIGVADPGASSTFYQAVFDLTFVEEKASPASADVVLADVRGNHVVLMDFAEDRNTTRNPVKLVFAVQDAAAQLQEVIDAGGSTAAAPQTFAGAVVALAYDLDGYLNELIEVPSVPAPVLVAVGVGVSSLDSAADFYTRVLGLNFSQDIDVPGFMDEKLLASPTGKGASVVLMHYEDESRTYDDVPAKIVFDVGDPPTYAARISRESPASQVEPGAVRDPDGYRIEFR
jgi:predicted enzyme related to lactoylglutathione lyase